MLKACGLAVLLVTLSGPGKARAEGGAKATARRLLAQGSAKYQAGDFAGAAADFQRAYAAYPSPKILFNLGQAYRALKQPDLAAESYGRFLADASQDVKLDERRLQQARAALKELAPLVVRIQVEVSPPSATLRLDGVRDVPRDFYLHRDSDPAAPHHLVASAPGHAPRNRDFTLAEVTALAADSRKLVVEPLQPVSATTAPAEPPAPVIIAVPQPEARPAPAPPAPAPAPAAALVAPAPAGHTAAYVALGIGGGLAAAGAIAGMVALSKNGSLGCGSSASPCTSATDVNAATSAHRTAIIADALLGGAVVAGATGAVLFFAAPTPSGSGGEVGVAGRF